MNCNQKNSSCIRTIHRPHDCGLPMEHIFSYWPCHKDKYWELSTYRHRIWEFLTYAKGGTSSLAHPNIQKTIELINFHTHTIKKSLAFILTYKKTSLDNLQTFQEKKYWRHKKDKVCQVLGQRLGGSGHKHTKIEPLPSYKGQHFGALGQRLGSFSCTRDKLAALGQRLVPHIDRD